MVRALLTVAWLFATMAHAESTDKVDAFSHWAFQPLSKPEAPAVRQVDWMRNEIDAFVLRRLEKSEVQPPERASLKTLRRRLHYALIGLPPENVFEIPAFDREIERLLNSSHYGEKWGRHWLDVARYADSNGLDENLAHAHAWRYRDYVVDCFNADIPFDRFVIEQIAGDLLAKGKPLSEANRLKIATGFIALGPKLLAEPDPMKLEMDMIDEQLDVIGQAFLGLTVGCARCHDHKSDPISMAEYYSMAGIFKSTVTIAEVKRPSRWFEHNLSSSVRMNFAQKHESLIEAQEKLIESFKDRANHELVALGKVAKIPKNPPAHYSEQTKNDLAVLERTLKEYESQRPELEYSMGVKEGNVTNLHVFLRGDPDVKGDLQGRGFPNLFPSMREDLPRENESGRLQLAHWISSGRNPLFARVIVNRVWRWHFGKGLVETTDDFGVLGAKPTHPELLDWLAFRFIEDGYSIKALHRRILTSSTWQASSVCSETTGQKDIDNRWYSRFPVRRLDAEALRDTLLVLGGQLDLSVGGKTWEYENRKHVFNHTSVDETEYEIPRRSLYLPIIRNHVYDMFNLFDFPDPNSMRGHRMQTSTAQQALFLMNSPLVRKTADSLSRKTYGPEAPEVQVTALYRKILNRAPSGEELERGLRFLIKFKNPDDFCFPGSGFAQSLLCSNEFLYLR
ncbi:MAG: DUF1553 domain-containing protein [Opitutae bacterium]|nr:DUF1553 domain-containing protein [Opitutae bacterium]